jgi:myo-inositol-1(or 4)-monophosphatase
MEQFIKNITRQAGNLVHRQFGKVGVKYTKSNSLDVVTQADLDSNSFLVKAIKKRFPTHGIVSEEMPAVNQKSPKFWIIDPLDGTMNFSKKIPLYAVLVAYVEKGKIQAACVSLPESNEIYFASKGGGAFLNGKRIFCSRKTELEDSLGCCGSSQKSAAQKLKFETELLRQTKNHLPWISTYASIGLSGVYTAGGRKDWYVSFKGYVWDFAAPVLIMQEAGVKVTNFEGKPWQLSDSRLVAANPLLHKQLIKFFK